LRRIVVVGTSGSGKTTLARRVAGALEIPHVELDALRHGPGWAETDDDSFRSQVAQQVAGEAWVVDGNYGVARDLIWRRAQLLIWLDYSLPLTFARVLRRTLRRTLTGEELWNGNRESLRMAFSRESILLWTLTTYRRRRRELPPLLARPEHAHLRPLRFRRPAQADAWLARLSMAAR
jgi:adenylate kinase family enzyme